MSYSIFSFNFLSIDRFCSLMYQKRWDKYLMSFLKRPVEYKVVIIIGFNLKPAS